MLIFQWQNSRNCIENRHPYIELWQMLYQMFNLVQNHQVNLSLLNEIPLKPIIEWPSSSKEEFKNTINKCNNLFTPELHHILWKHLKIIIEDNRCLFNIINIANTCINIGHWPSHFKMFSFQAQQNGL